MFHNRESWTLNNDIIARCHSADRKCEEELRKIRVINFRERPYLIKFIRWIWSIDVSYRK